MKPAKKTHRTRARDPDEYSDGPKSTIFVLSGRSNEAAHEHVVDSKAQTIQRRGIRVPPGAIWTIVSSRENDFNNQLWTRCTLWFRPRWFRQPASYTAEGANQPQPVVANICILP